MDTGKGKVKMAKPEPVLVSALTRVPSPKINSNKKSITEVKRLFKKNLSQARWYTLLSPALGDAETGETGFLGLIGQPVQPI